MWCAVVCVVRCGVCGALSCCELFYGVDAFLYVVHCGVGHPCMVWCTVVWCTVVCVMHCCVVHCGVVHCGVLK